MSKIARHCDLRKHELIRDGAVGHWNLVIGSNESAECITESFVVKTGFTKPVAENIGRKKYVISTKIQYLE